MAEEYWDCQSAGDPEEAFKTWLKEQVGVSNSFLGRWAPEVYKCLKEYCETNQNCKRRKEQDPQDSEDEGE